MSGVRHFIVNEGPTSILVEFRDGTHVNCLPGAYVSGLIKSIHMKDKGRSQWRIAPIDSDDAAKPGEVPFQ